LQGTRALWHNLAHAGRCDGTETPVVPRPELPVLAVAGPEAGHARAIEILSLPGSTLVTLVGVAWLVVLAFELLRARRDLAALARRDVRIALGLAVASLVLRLLVVHVQDLTDGITVQMRFLDGALDFGSLGLLSRLLLPASLAADPQVALGLLSGLAGLLPVSTYGLALALGLARREALLAALLILGWPLHATLYAGGFDQGAIVTLATLAAWLLVVALDRDDLRFAASSLSLAAFLVWCRPDAMMVVALLGVLLLRAPRRRLVRAPLLGGFAVLLGSAGLRVAFLASSGLAGETLQRLPPLTTLGRAVQYFASAGDAVLPLEIPFGVLLFLALRRSLRPLVLAGLGLGLVPWLSRGCSAFEWFRYASHALPWLALATASGLTAGLEALGARLARDGSRGGARRRWLAALPLALYAGALVARPLVHLDYLTRDYDQRVTDAFFLRALPHVPEGCWVAVPATTADPGTNSYGRYALLAARALGRERAEHTIVPTFRLARSLDPGADAAEFPDLSPDLDRAFSVGPQPPPSACAYLLWSWECENPAPPAGAMRDPGFCGAVRDRAQLEPVLEERADLLDHRLVTEPRVIGDPRSRRDVALVLYRVHPRPEGP